MSTQAVEARLRELCQELLSHRKLIIASNRGPIDYRIDEGGSLKGRRGSGGVVTALSAISQYLELTWVASAMGEGDRRAAEQAQGGRFQAPPPSQNLYLRFVVIHLEDALGRGVGSQQHGDDDGQQGQWRDGQRQVLGKSSHLANVEASVTQHLLAADADAKDDGHLPDADQ